MEVIKGQSKELTESTILSEIARIMENDNLSIDDALSLFIDTIIYDDDILALAENLEVLYSEITIDTNGKSILEIIKIELYLRITDIVQNELTK